MDNKIRRKVYIAKVRIVERMRQTTIGSVMINCKKKIEFKTKSKLIDQKIRQWMDEPQLPFFSSIEIETVNRCNGVCPFCPVNVHQEQRPYAKMDINLFYKLINELSEREYKGKISLYSNNEPFLDERIIDMYQYAKQKLPEAYFFIYTNGTLLNIQKFLEIKPYLDEFVIDNYNDKMEVNKNLREVYDYILKNPDECKNVNFSFRLQNQILTTRGGLAPNKRKKNVIKPTRCKEPFYKMIVRPGGGISLCCNDALGIYTMGDCNKQSLYDIWYGNKFVHLRNAMLKKGRDGLKLCNNCDACTS